jgi:hypothetical protein
MQLFTSLALVVVMAAASANAQGVFTDTTCSCSLFTPTAASKCVRPVAGTPGQCIEEKCGSGMKCDMSGAALCKRSKCGKWIAAPGVKTSAGRFACSLGADAGECVTEAAVGPGPQTTADPTCLYTDDKCTCVGMQKHSKCVRLKEKIGLQAKCTLEDCKSGYKCDCQDPTHMCKRTKCDMFSASTVQSSGPFGCIESKGDCAVVIRELIKP